jgi:hypothetical protein
LLSLHSESAYRESPIDLEGGVPLPDIARVTYGEK